MLATIQIRISCFPQLLENLNIKIYKIKFSPVILYGSETWFLTLREEHRIKVFENKVLRRISVLKRAKSREASENCLIRSFIMHMLYQILLG
jgi:hypothetical protein